MLKKNITSSFLPKGPLLKMKKEPLTDWWWRKICVNIFFIPSKVYGKKFVILSGWFHFGLLFADDGLWREREGGITYAQTPPVTTTFLSVLAAALAREGRDWTVIDSAAASPKSKQINWGFSIATDEKERKKERKKEKGGQKHSSSSSSSLDLIPAGNWRLFVLMW